MLQRRPKRTIIALLLFSLSLAYGFTPITTRRRRVLGVLVAETKEDDDIIESSSSSSPRKQRRKQRKSPMEPMTASSSTSIPIQDIRTLAANQASNANQPETSERTTAVAASSIVDPSSSSLAQDTSNDDPLAQLLKDAESLRVQDSDGNIRTGGWKSTVRNVLSTIVTVDFFVVCGLLLWFLAGIASSVLLRNDAVQIAFNGIFEPIVQPALGILMVASISDAVLKDDA